MEELLKRIEYSFLNGNTRRVLIELWDLFLTLWPYLLIGIAISTLVKIYITQDLIKKVLSGNKLITIVFAAVLGVISPLGSYVTLPLIATLLSIGVPLAPLIAFAMASPVINPTIFLLTKGTLGMEMAIMRVLAAILLGVLAGFTINMLFARHKNLFEIKTLPKDDILEKKLGKGAYSNRLFLYEFWRYTRYISKHFFLGIFIAAIVKVVIPANLIMRFLGNGNLSVLLATGAGVPLYSCGGAALPVLQELRAMGVQSGAILAFCVSGPAIKLSTLVLLNTLFKRGILYLYLFLTVLVSLFLGFIYQLIAL